ncbi:MAG: transposase [Deltaproteobacteria bacterium]|nr:transposase [Deltaproteobacteria bacterium]
MARPLRIQYPDAWYHVMNRGLNRSKIFSSPHDYQAFIGLLKEASAMWKVRIAAYCLMSNHYHLLLQTPEGNLSRCMRHINGIYTQRFNRLYKIDGPLFRGRYKSIVIDGDSYLLELVRYIHRNPLHAGIVKRIDDYTWSSHRAYISEGNEENWLYKDFVLTMLEGNKAKRRQAYINFVDKEEPESLIASYEKRKSPLLLGTKDFVDNIRQKYGNKAIIEEMPQAKELALDQVEIETAVSRIYQIEVDDLLKLQRGKANEARNVAIYLIRKHTGAPLKTIGIRFGMNSYSSVSSVILRIKQAMKRNKKLQQKVASIERLLT